MAVQEHGEPDSETRPVKRLIKQDAVRGDGFVVHRPIRVRRLMIPPSCRILSDTRSIPCAPRKKRGRSKLWVGCVRDVRARINATQSRGERFNPKGVCDISLGEDNVIGYRYLL